MSYQDFLSKRVATAENVIAAVERTQTQHRRLHAQAWLAMSPQRELSDDWYVAEGVLRPLAVLICLKAA